MMWLMNQFNLTKLDFFNTLFITKKDILYGRI